MSNRGQGERMTEEEEDWQKYASSGFGSTDLDLWNDLEVVEIEEAFYSGLKLVFREKEIQSTITIAVEVPIVSRFPKIGQFLRKA